MYMYVVCVYVCIYATYHVCVRVSTFTRENGLTIIRHAVAVVYSIMYVCMFVCMCVCMIESMSRSERTQTRVKDRC